MGRYDTALAANQQGWRDRLSMDNPLAKFMAGLRQGHGDLTQNQNAQWLKEKFGIEQQAKQDELERKQAIDDRNEDNTFFTTLANARDPHAAAKALAMFRPEKAEKFKTMADSVANSRGEGYKAANVMAGTDKTKADTALTGEKTIDEQQKRQYEIDLLRAQADLARANAEKAGRLPVDKALTPGSAEWARVEKVKGEKAKNANKFSSAISSMNDLETAVDSLLGDKAIKYITGQWRLMPDDLKPGALDAESKRAQIANRIGLDTLSRLKTESGAGLGSVTEAEHKLLQSYIANIERAQSTENLVRNLNLIKDWVKKNRNKLNGDLAATSAYDGASEPTVPKSVGGPSDDDILGALRGGK